MGWAVYGAIRAMSTPNRKTFFWMNPHVLNIIILNSVPPMAIFNATFIIFTNKEQS